MHTLAIDIETFSTTDLAKCGVYRYAEDNDFELLLFAYSIDDGPVHVISTATGEAIPNDVLTAIKDPTVTKWAFNAAFERICLSAWLLPPGQYLDPHGWRCTMVHATALGLPRSLKHAGAALNLQDQKIEEGADLIKRFCIPTRGSATDVPALFDADGITHRNRPESAPEAWADFIEYCRRDVEVETQIRLKLAGLPLPEHVWEEYAVDQAINDTGVAVDLHLAAQAVEADRAYREHCLDEARELTGLDNPASPTQLRQWLESNGVPIDSMTKDAVADALETATGAPARVLQLRQDMSRSSVKKYEAMQKATGADSRARGLLQFYGAGRTGRWAGRLIQVQNLPRNYLPDLDQARELVREGHHDALEMLYDSVPDTLSQLIRTALIPADGHRFIVADYSAIEARVLAWMAGQQNVLDTFERGEDIYCATASGMFGVPVEKGGINGDLRQKGKVATLACVAEGQEVLTDKGLVPIENITTDHRVWDGHNWVRHQGLIDKGLRHVITYQGLTATYDHLVWIDGQEGPVPLGDAAASGACLQQTGDGRRPIRLGGDHQPAETLERDMEYLLRPDQMHRLPVRAVAEPRSTHSGDVERLPDVLAARGAEAPTAEVAGTQDDRRAAAMREPELRGVLELRGAGDSVPVRECRLRSALGGKALGASSGPGTGPDRQRRALRTGKPPVGNPSGEQPEQASDSHEGRMGSEPVALLSRDRDPETLRGHDPRGDHRRRGESRPAKAKELARHSGTTRVYDLLNAGPNHRFTVSDVLVHNCGYQGGVGALKAMGAIRMGLDEGELQPIVDAWRSSNKHIVDYWYALDRAAQTTIKTGQPQTVRNLTLRRRAGALTITLPSGRDLVYPGAHLGRNRFDKPSIVFKGIGMNRRVQAEETYGGKLVENIIQAVARDLMAYAINTVQGAGHRIVMTVHDELVVEAPPETTVDEICDLMATAPEWAAGLPIEADGYDCHTYRKED